MNESLRLPCPTCSGTGTDTHEDRHAETNRDTCRTCGGTGAIPARTGESAEASFRASATTLALDTKPASEITEGLREAAKMGNKPGDITPERLALCRRYQREAAFLEERDGFRIEADNIERLLAALADRATLARPDLRKQAEAGAGDRDPRLDWRGAVEGWDASVIAATKAVAQGRCSDKLNDEQVARSALWAIGLDRVWEHVRALRAAVAARQAPEVAAALRKEADRLLDRAAALTQPGHPPEAAAPSGPVGDALNNSGIFGEGGQGKLTIRDLAYTAFMRAKGKNDEDGGPTDWFTDTLPLVLKGIEKLRGYVDEAAQQTAPQAPVADAAGYDDLGHPGHFSDEPEAGGPSRAPVADTAGVSQHIDHEFKSAPDVFWPAARGAKMFEFRKDDRGGYHVGQTVRLRCYEAGVGYNGEQIDRVITNVLYPGQYGLQPGYCILSLAALTPPQAARPGDGEDAEHVRDMELQEVADGCWGGVFAPGAARELLAERRAARSEKPAPVQADAAEGRS